MTQRDKWKKRPVVENYNHWKDAIKTFFVKARAESRKKIDYPLQTCRLEAVFGVTSLRGDADNLTKGLKDSLNGLAWPDDKIQHIWEEETRVRYLCGACMMGKPQKSGGIKCQSHQGGRPGCPYPGVHVTLMKPRAGLSDCADFFTGFLGQPNWIEGFTLDDMIKEQKVAERRAQREGKKS